MPCMKSGFDTAHMLEASPALPLLPSPVSFSLRPNDVKHNSFHAFHNPHNSHGHVWFAKFGSRLSSGPGNKHEAILVYNELAGDKHTRYPMGDIVQTNLAKGH